MLLAVIMLVLQGCAASHPPADPTAYRNRTKTIVNKDVTVTVAVPTTSEAHALYGVDLAKQNIQPVWVTVDNNSADTYWFLPSGLDPDYFSPSEAAFAFHGRKEDTNQLLNEAFHKLQFQNPIPAGSSKSGYVLSNLDEGLKAVDIDLISRNDVKNNTFVIADPEFKADHKEVNFETLYAAEDIVNIETEEELRLTLEALPCCTTNADGDVDGDPLNLVLIGDGNDIIPALVRRNWHTTEIIWSKAIRRTINSFFGGERYRYSPISPLYVFGRKQDIAWQKARSTINERNHMRFWEAPIRFRGKRVFVGQISRDIGVKFTLKSPTISTHVIDPDVDGARRYFVEDLAYSQALSRLGFVKGVGRVARDEPRMNTVGDPFYTDGLRAVLFFEPRPFSLSDIDIMEWETPTALYKDTDAGDSTKEPVAAIEAPIVKRAQTKTINGIRTSTAMVGDKEAQEIFGIDLARKNIQAVWIEVENNTDRPVLLLPTAIDPDYFAPLEVAFAYHKVFSKDANAALDERLLKLNFPLRSPIVPGSQASGYIFTNWTRGMKVIDVDILGRQFCQNFTFFAPNPDTSMGQEFFDRMERMFPASELNHVESEAELRSALERLPCCAAGEDGRPTGEPLNVVVIGTIDDWTTAFARSGYRYHRLNPRHVFGRPQDVSGRKLKRSYTKAQAHTIRFWHTPIRYRGVPVWLAQTSSRLGGRFADDESPEQTLPLNPLVDEARIDLTQGLAYSQALKKIGHVKGAGATPMDTSAGGIPYTTDGLRVVLVFGDRPTSLAGIDFFDWERLADKSR
jgi:hypothetical protein